MKKLLALSMILFAVSCQKTLSDKEIISHVWKCGTPCGLSDVIIFNENTILVADTIFYKNKPYGKIVKRTNNFDEDTKISIINLENPVITDTCVFHAK